MRLTALAVAASLGAGACAGRTDEELLQQAGVPPLTAAELRPLLSGSTARGLSLNPRGFFVLSFHPSGSVRGKIGNSSAQASAARQAPLVDDGNWRVTPEGRLCLRWRQWQSGAESCERVYRSGRKFEGYLANGQLALSFRVDPSTAGGD